MSAVEGNEMEGYEALVSELRANPPVAPERLRQRLLEGAPAPRRQRSRKRKLVMVVVPVAAALAVGGAFVHGFLNSGSTHPTAAGPLPINSTVGGEVVHGPSGAPKTAQATSSEFAPATQTQSKSLQQYGVDAPDSIASGSTPLALAGVERQAVTIPRNRLVHVVASLQVGVKSKDLSAKTNEASQMVGSFGGYAQSVSYQADHHGNGEAVLSLRVPVQNAEKAIQKLGGLGTLLSQQVSTQDLQAKVTHQTSAIGSLRRAIAVYEAALRSTTLPATQRAALQIKLNDARRALSRLRHARAGTVQQAATADISLLLTTNGHALVAPQHHGSTRIGRLLGSAAHFLALEGIIVLYALIVLAPLLLIAALVWWILRERRRREERLLSTA
jgi:Domain of unknown function (DUF4349)